MTESMTVPAQIAEFPRVSEFIENQAQQAGLDPKEITQLLIAAEEAYVNIAHYAYADAAPGQAEIYCEALSDGTGIAVSFRDNGQPFNPLANSEPEINAPLQEREIGGLGIFMIKKMMDDVSYCYQDGKNQLTLVKKKKA